jgi:hypothetical protein
LVHLIGFTIEKYLRIYRSSGMGRCIVGFRRCEGSGCSWAPLCLKKNIPHDIRFMSVLFLHKH